MTFQGDSKSRTLKAVYHLRNGAKQWQTGIANESRITLRVSLVIL